MFEPPQRGALGRERAARGDGVAVAGADQRETAALQDGTARFLAGEDAAEIVGELGTGAHRVDPGLLARMAFHRGDIADGEDGRVDGRALGFVGDDEAARGKRQAGVGKPRRGGGLGHPQGFVELDRVAAREDQAMRFDPHDRIPGGRADAAFGQHPREAAADARVVRGQ